MQIAAITAPVVTGRTSAPLERVTINPLRLWPALTVTWMRHLERQIDDDLRWLDPNGARKEFRSASHG